MASVFTLYVATEVGPVQVLWSMLGQNPKIETLFAPGGTRTPLYTSEITAHLSVTAAKLPEDREAFSEVLGSKPTATVVFSMSQFQFTQSTARMWRTVYNLMKAQNGDDLMLEGDLQVLILRKDGNFQVDKRLEENWRRTGYPYIPVPCEFVDLPKLF